MKIYSVVNPMTGYAEDFFCIKAAKAAMRKHDADGFITKVYSNGDFVECGEIKLKGSNKRFIANSPGKMKKPGY